IPIRRLVRSRTTAAQPQPTRYYRAARRSTLAIQTLLRRLTTTSADPDSFACLTVASTSDRLRCNQRPPQHRRPRRPRLQHQDLHRRQELRQRPEFILPRDHARDLTMKKKLAAPLASQTYEETK